MKVFKYTERIARNLENRPGRCRDYKFKKSVIRLGVTSGCKSKN